MIRCNYYEGSGIIKLENEVITFENVSGIV
jgi:hypothetical protein